ncbi:MAG: nicotinate-nucleotide--dimethylbenzimidazole phosphoribosyltransferase [Rhizobiaceae bacterium]
MTSGLPFDDFRALVASLPAPRNIAKISERFDAFRGLHGNGGELEKLALWAAGWNANEPVLFVRPLVAVFAGTNALGGGQNSAANSQTQAMAAAATDGHAAVNALCAQRELGLKVFDLALGHPSGDIAVQPALDERGCAATMAFGMEAASGGTDILGIGSFGRGASACSAALLSACGGVPADQLDNAWPGGEVLDRGHAERALKLHKHHLADPLEALRRLGSREIAAMAGAILAARMERIPVILDGPSALAAASVLKAMNADALGHCRYAGGQADAARSLGLETVTAIASGFDGGAGAAMAIGMVRDAIKVASSL